MMHHYPDLGSASDSGGGGGKGTQKSFIWGGSAPMSNPLPFYTIFDNSINKLMASAH